MRKVFRYSLITLAVLLLLILFSAGGLLYYLHTENGKTWLNTKVTALLEEQLGVPVNVGDIEIDFPDGVSLRDVNVFDHKKNLMLHLKRAEVHHITYNQLNDVFSFGEIKINGFDFRLRHYTGDRLSNLEFVIDKLTPKTSSGKKGTEVAFHIVEITDGKFRWDNDKQPFANDSFRQIDWEHILVPSFSGKFSDVWIDGGVRVRIKELSFHEKSGFSVENFKTYTKISGSEMEFENLYIKTPHSEIKDYLKFSYNTYDNFSDFIDSVTFNSSFINSKVSLKDISYFTTALKNKQDAVTLSGKITGKVSDIRGKNVSAFFGNSYLYGYAHLRGLPSISETFIDAQIGAGKTSRKELMQLFPETDLPAIIDKLGLTEAKGNFTGFINDFVTRGSFISEIGSGATDLNMKLGNTKSYSGKITLDNFNLGALTDEKKLGYVSLNGDITGQGFSLDDIRATLHAGVSRFDFKGYSYSNLIVNGDFGKKFFKGGLVTKDPNCDLDFLGTVDYQSKPEFIGHADVRNINFCALNLLKDTLVMHSSVDFNFRGLKPDEMEGMVKARGTQLTMKNKIYNFDSVQAFSKIDGNKRSILLHSNLVNASFSGDFKVSEIDDMMKTTLASYIDTSFLVLKGKTVSKQYMDFDVRFADLELLFRLLHLPASIRDSGYVTGTLSSEDGKISMDGYIPGMSYKNYYFDKIKLGVEGKSSVLNVSASAEKMMDDDTLLMRNIVLHSRSVRNNFHLDAGAADARLDKKIQLAGMLNITGSQGTFAMEPSALSVGDSVWDITANEIVLYKGDSLIDFPLVQLTNQGQEIKISGKYAAKSDLPIRIMTDNLAVKSISPFVPGIRDFDGKINGQLLISNIHKKPYVEAAMFVNPLVYSGDTMGILAATTRYDEASQKLAIDGTLQNFETLDDQLHGVGSIDFRRGQALDFILKLKETPMGILQPLLSGVFSDLKGNATAEIKVKGNLSQPIIAGNIAVKNGAVKVDYLQTTYRYNHTFRFEGKDLLIDNMELNDVNDNKAVINGVMRLRTLTDIYLDLGMKAKEFQLLNTKIEDNDTYYGVANATGTVTIKGPLNSLAFYMKLKSDRGTTFVLPVGNESVSGHDYISFVKASDTIQKTHTKKLSGLSVKSDLEITPDARLQIIFDPRSGHMIDGYGHGNLKLNYSSAGDFTMYQTIYIDKGTYKFAAFDVISKPFTLKEGSYITWSGNPYEADMNVQAYNRVRTSIQPLLQSTTTGNAAEITRVLPVDAKLDLKGALLKPLIKLDFDIQETGTLGFYSGELENQIRKIKSDEQELNKQVVSLIVFKRFSPVNQGFGTGAATSGATAAGGDLLLGQFNDWISRLTENLQVNVDYRPGEGPAVRANLNALNNTLNINGSYETNTARNSTYNVEAKYKITEDGSLQSKVFNRSANNPLIVTDNTNTAGVGLSFRKEFDKFSELLPSWMKKKKSKK